MQAEEALQSKWPSLGKELDCQNAALRLHWLERVCLHSLHFFWGCKDRAIRLTLACKQLMHEHTNACAEIEVILPS